VVEIGSSLREARERQKLELPQIERDTRIRAKFLLALEDEQFDRMPAPAYAKGFLRTYADYLGLDAQQFVDEYNSRFAHEEELPPPAPVRIRRQRRILDLRLLVLPAAAILALIGWQLERGTSHHTTLPPTPTHAPTKKKTTATPSRVATTAPTTARLLLTAARGRCWLLVRRHSASGSLVYESTLAQGQMVRFTAGRLWIRIGAPWSLDATLNGKPLRLPAATGNILVTNRAATIAP